MRDLVAPEALQTMARDAARRFRELVAAGNEIPYDVEEPGHGSPLPRYVPLTERFVRDHAPALLELDSFGSACAAIESSDLAGPYLEEFGIDAPPNPRARAELAGTVFLCRLWADSTDFSLDGDRLGEAIAELEAGGQVRDDEIEVVVPLRGLQMPLVRLELATATIIRADTVDVPAEARTADGMGAAGWEPTFLAAARVSASEGDAQDGPSPDAGARSVDAFRQLITALRLFQAGGVGLGPYAWTRAGTDRWRRIATGAGRPRRGGYRLADDSLGELITLSRVLAYRSSSAGRDGPSRSGALARAISRFEAGLERNVVLEALNDYLLALRFVLEGGGPADLGLAMRVAALCAEPEQRSAIKAVVDRGLALERQLWSGDPAPVAEGAPTAADTVAAIEELTRAILRDAACGHLGGDLRATADEVLLADGLAVGEGQAEQRGGSEEWDLPTAEHDHASEQENASEHEDASEKKDVSEHEGVFEQMEGFEQDDGLEQVDASEPQDVPEAELWMDVSDDWREGESTRIEDPPMQVPEPEGRITIVSPPHEEEEESLFAHSQNGRSEHPQERQPERRAAADRVAYLFPRPEPTEWNVTELSYDRRRRSAPHPERRVS
jgi:hypothetical protein